VAHSIGTFAWTYDGNRLLYVSADDGAVHSFDITSGADRTLSTRTADPCAGPFFTTTRGDQLLFLDEASGGTTLVALNVDTAQERVYPNLPVGFPASVLPAAYVGADVTGSFVDLVQAYPTRITRLDLASGTLTTLLSDEWRGVLTFSPDHQQVVLVDNPYGKPTVASIRDLRSGQEVSFQYVGWLTFEPSAITPSSFLAWSRTWAREDRPVAAGAVARSWTWGPSPFAMEEEQYADAPGGRRPVLYYDKSRMEINTPYGDQSSRWFVTNGLLAKELITGQMQVGNDPSAVVNRGPAQVNVAGDSNDPNGPTYASLTHLLAAPPVAVGSEIKASLGRSGAVGNAGPGGVHATQLVSESNHTIADVFWAYLTSQGPIWDGARITSGQLFDPTFFATGFPITEAYWTRVKVGGVERDVLLQCFERRCLTYTPSNPDGWKVEMGNVGRHYYAWRYGG
ncbi:MAG TPA: hypothetical protein VFU72_10720, partial [Nitrolancea sp.]|nr:hypothetical protein [Nitrolancea sp.]